MEMSEMPTYTCLPCSSGPVPEGVSALSFALCFVKESGGRAEAPAPARNRMRRSAIWNHG